MRLTLNRREELAEEAADCEQASKDCFNQRCYADAARLERRANEIRKRLADWAMEGAAAAAIAEIMQRS